MTEVSADATPQTAQAFKQTLSQAKARVEAALHDLLLPAMQPGELARPQRLLEAMHYSVLAGGKRLRPFLLIETARALGLEGDGPLRAAASIELVHCYSLVHDDLPAMDDDDMRRGRLTTHKAFDEATAILAGDALLTLAFDSMADAPTHPDGGVRAALCCGLARASGLGGMAGGQMLDIAAETAAMPLDPAAISRMQAMKTGALLRFSVEAGALIAQARPAQRAALSRYGAAIGAAFQIADDLLDAEGDAATLGKRARKDAERNKATLVAALGAARARAELERCVGAAQAALAEAGLGGEGHLLHFAARYIASRSS
jgi:farnesyl diphosphate synthase